MSEKERQIFSAAVEIFSKKGFNAATTKDIAKAAGVAEGTIFRYYKTKKDILHVIMLKMVEILSAIAIKSVEELLKNAKDKELKQIFYEILIDRMELFDKIFPMARAVFPEALFHEEIRDAIFENLIYRAGAAYEAFHIEMVKKGFLRADLPAMAVFRTMFANVAIFIVAHRLSPHPFENIEQEFETIFDIIINGIAVHR
jgi:AcrR family transcriptional regulator